MTEPSRSCSIASLRADPSTWPWPTTSSSLRGRTRSASGATSVIRSPAASVKRSPIREKYAAPMSRQEQTGLDDEFAPVLPGDGASDYERYLRTDELLALQKTPAEWVHRDELLFQTVHQSSELWLKHACAEVAGATEHVTEGRYDAAERLLRRAQLAARFVYDQLEMLEQMSP